MTTLPARRRTKRSTRVTLTSMGVAGATLMLAGCDDGGPQQQVDAFPDVAACVASGRTEADCNTAYNQALASNATEAPRYDGQQTCEEQHGVGRCVPANSGGQSFFMPMMTGFLLGQALSPRPYYYGPGGGYYLGNGYRLGYGGGPGKFYAQNRALEAPKATPRIQSRSSVVSRGGFGGRASGGGWGG